MKKLIATVMIALALAGCSQPLKVDNRNYESYGLLNEEKKSDKICYEANTSDIVLSILFIETVAIPIYIIGFDYKEPKRVKNKDGTCN